MTRALAPIEVACPDCQAPEGTTCRMGATADHGAIEHAARRDVARMRSLLQGTCALCGRWMVRGAQVEGGPVDAWHPEPEAAAACPPMADPGADWNAYAAQVNAGLSPGHPGLEVFVPGDQTQAPSGLTFDQAYTEASIAGVEPPLVICPECHAGKHTNCNGQAWDTTRDEPTTCGCSHAEAAGA